MDKGQVDLQITQIKNKGYGTKTSSLIILDTIPLILKKKILKYERWKGTVG